MFGFRRSFYHVSRGLAACRRGILTSGQWTRVREVEITQKVPFHSTEFFRQQECEGGSCEIPVRSPSDAAKLKEGKKFVDATVSKYAVVIFSSTSCPFCMKAKETLAKYNLDSGIYNVVELDDNKNLDGIMDYLKQKSGARTLPRVFIGGKFVGGGDDTVRLHESGELRNLLKLESVIQKEERSSDRQK